MKITVNANMLKHMFEDWNRDYYSYEGCEALLDFYDEIDENMDLDIVGICCECSEYGEDATLPFAAMLSDYGYLLDDDAAELDEDEKIASLVEILEERTTVLHVSNGNYIIFEH